MPDLINIYHGSANIVDKPIFGSGKSYNDYGRGFYCTEHLELSKYRKIAALPVAENEIYVIDIIRNNWKNGQSI